MWVSLREGEGVVGGLQGEAVVVASKEVVEVDCSKGEEGGMSPRGGG